MKNILPNWANWIARDKDGTLVVFEEEPRKDIKEWSGFDNDGNFLEIEDESGKYMFIKWEDERPYKIYTTHEVECNSLSFDNINKPTHYHSGNIDVIKFSEENFSKEERKGFHRINAIKYITRYDRKNGVEDLNKAKFYIDKLIEMEEQPNE